MMSIYIKKLNRFSEDVLWQQISGPCESLSLSKLPNVSTLVSLLLSGISRRYVHTKFHKNLHSKGSKVN
jgi:hypothetical protein